MKQAILRTVQQTPLFFLILAAAALPIFYISGVQNGHVTGKLFLLTVLVGTSLISVIIRTILSEKLVTRTSSIHIILVVILLATWVSQILSSNSGEGIIGSMSSFHISAVYITVLITMVLLLIQEVQTAKQFHAVIGAWLFGSTIAAFIFSVLSYSAFNGVAIALGFSEISFSLPSIQPTSTALYFLIVSLVSLGLLMRKAKHWSIRLVPFISLLGSLLVVFAHNISSIFFLGLVGTILLIMWSWVDAAKIRFVWAGVSAVLFFLFLLSGLFGVPRGITVQTVPEITMSTETSWSLTQSFLSSSVPGFLFGVGPTQYEAAFFQEASASMVKAQQDVNVAPVPVNTMALIVVEYGFIFFVALLALMLLGSGVIVHGISQFYSKQRKSVKVFGKRVSIEHEFKDSIVLGIGWTVLTIGLWVFQYDLILWWLWFVLLGLFTVGFAHYAPESLRTSVKQLRFSPQVKMVSIFVGVGFAVVGVIGLSFFVRFIQADAMYVHALSQPTSQAIATIEDAVRLRPGYVQYRLALAQQYAVVGAAASRNGDQQQATIKLAQAVNEARTAADMSPHNVETYQLLGRYYRHARAITPEANVEAANVLDKALELSPHDAALHWARGDVAVFAGEYEAALEYFGQAIALSPLFVAPYHAKAETFIALEQFKQALAVYDEMVEKNVDPRQAQYEKGRVLYNLGGEHQIDQAKVVWEALLIQEPQHANTLFSLGLLYEKEGSIGKAKGLFEKLANFYPDNEDIQQKLLTL